MRRKLRLPNVMYRFLLDVDGDPFGGAGGGIPASPPPAAPIAEDIAPVNGGPDRGLDEGLSGVGDTSAPNQGGNQPAPVRAQPTDPNNRAGSFNAPVAPVAGNDWQSIRDAGTAIGYQFPANITDDRAALTHLIQLAQSNRNADMYAQLGRKLAPNAEGIQQYLQQKSTPAAPSRQPWEAPEFDERWAGLVERNEATGIFVSKPGVPHEIANKVNAYVEWKSAYDRDPAKMINGMVEARAKTIAESTFREQFQAQAHEQTINSIVQGNGTWLYQVNEQGQRVADYNGRPMLSPLGARYMHHLEGAKNMGVRDPRQQDALAKNLVRGEIAQQAQHQAWAANQVPANPQAVANPNRNPLQAIPAVQRANTPGATDPSATGKSLSEMLREGFAAEGVNDSDFAHRND